MQLKISLIFFLLFSLTVGQSNKANSNEEEINIRALVANQIKLAEENLTSTSEIQSDTENPNLVLKKEKPQEKPQKITKESSWTILTNFVKKQNPLFPIFIAVELLLVGTILVLFLSGRKKKTTKTDLKQSIKLIRSEKIRSKMNNEKSKIRTMLTNTSIRIDDGGKSIIQFVRKQKIAKGEMMLALKVRNLNSIYKAR